MLAEKLTHSPGQMRESDIAPLRAAGLDDTGIHDAVQVISYFNYINRVADALHVDLEPEMPADPRG
jgi:alkylhydroperoxidase family enzyme